MGGKIVRSFSYACILFIIEVFFFNLCFVGIDIVISRPKQVKDVAHQDEVVRVLTNTLETTNVMDSFSFQCFRIINFIFCLKPYHFFLIFLNFLFVWDLQLFNFCY